MKNEVVITGMTRTAVGRFGGTLKDMDSAALASIVIQGAIERSGISRDQVDEVIMGEVRQSSRASNVARVAALMAGIPEEVPAYTTNRLCASGMQAMISATQSILLDRASIIVAGGTENMSQAPIYLRNARFGEGNPHVVDSNLEVGQQPVETYGNQLGMGITAENVADMYRISRENQDEFALSSQHKAKKAMDAGKFKEEITPVEFHGKKLVVFDTDEHPRETTLEKLASLKPAFKKEGTVTAGNACGRNDGAAAMVLMSSQSASTLGIQPIARIVDWAVTGISPTIMGMGPVRAIQNILERTDMSLDQIGLIELNEAFASQALAVIREAKLDMDKVNVNGGAIALGHPLGATGTKISITLLYEMKRRNVQFGIATLCVGGGQGMAIMYELLS